MIDFGKVTSVPLQRDRICPLFHATASSADGFR
jgi:hypothetical protein